MQKPSIGRIVHVSWYGQRVPAIITHVWSESTVNVSLLAKLDANPELPFGHEVSSSGYEEEIPEATNVNGTDINHRSWTWPPRVA